jgi:energy-coupling factor transporter ATP-binding protein EcfA2
VTKPTTPEATKGKPMKLQLQPGRALVLTGPEGCGKSTAARGLASRAGAYAEIDARHLDSAFGLSRAMQNSPNTVIVEGLPSLAALITVARALKDGEIELNAQGRPPRIVKTPNFIFCSGDADAFCGDANADRRFWVVKL